jgi:hypothetical protein
MSRSKRRALRLPRRLVWSALAVGTLGCGSATTRPRDAAADLATADLATADLATADFAAAADLRPPPPPDGCALVVSCIPAVAGAKCDGTFCGTQGCPNGCEPYV